MTKNNKNINSKSKKSSYKPKNGNKSRNRNKDKTNLSSKSLKVSKSSRRGKITGLASGYGFVQDLVSDDEFMLLPADMNQVLDGDEVIFVASNNRVRGKHIAKVKKIITRPRQIILARYVKYHNGAQALPCSLKMPRHIEINNPDTSVANNSIVEVKLISPPSMKLMDELQGELLRVLGDDSNTNYETDLSINEFALREKFPPKVLKEAKSFPQQVAIGAGQTELKRRSLVDLPFVTIDGSDARDFDDAVYCREHKGNQAWTLWVAIADVSHYVTPGSNLDKEAAMRTSSVYFPTRVVPMLPENLSNGLCSLNPNVNRLTLVCEMKINTRGEILNKEFYKAVIKSQARLIYEDVTRLINSNYKNTKGFTPNLLDSIRALHKLTNILLGARKKRNSLDFTHLEEVKIDVDDTGKVTQIYQYHRGIAHLMIEEAMLFANTCAAEFIAKAKLPFCYRINPPPSQEKLDDLRAFLRSYEIKVPPYPATSADYSRILNLMHQYEEAASLEMMLLRSLQQATYAVRNEGHFGLNYDSYTHFTSPIRRYPDLLNHRAINYILHKNKQQNYPYNSKEVSGMAAFCSQQERNINKAVWQVMDALKCHYLDSCKKDVYYGTIVHVAERGFFVKFKDVSIEGMVRVRSLRDDYYRYDNADRTLRGLKTSRTFSIGNKVKVKVDRINLDERKIDLLLIEDRS